VHFLFLIAFVQIAFMYVFTRRVAVTADAAPVVLPPPLNPGL
jgi:hypothetical protein